MFAFILLALLVSLAPGLVTSAAAQTTREEQLAADEAARARQVTPPGPQPGERIISLFDGPVTTGVTASFGGLIPEANFNAGVAYTRFFKDTGTWTARGVYSIRQFWLIEASSRLPRLWNDRLEITTRAALADGPRVEFFGIGNATPEDARVFYGHRLVDVGGAATVRPTPFVVISGGADFLHREAGHNRGSGPSLEERFDPASIPAFGDTINFGHFHGSAAVDWRNAAGYASRGGLYQASVHSYRPGGGDSAGSGGAGSGGAGNGGTGSDGRLPSSASTSTSCSTCRFCATTGSSACAGVCRQR